MQIENRLVLRADNDRRRPIIFTGIRKNQDIANIITTAVKRLAVFMSMRHT